jgi:hypothetical protein
MVREQRISKVSGKNIVPPVDANNFKKMRTNPI